MGNFYYMNNSETNFVALVPSGSLGPCSAYSGSTTSGSTVLITRAYGSGVNPTITPMTVLQTATTLTYTVAGFIGCTYTYNTVAFVASAAPKLAAPLLLAIVAAAAFIV